MLSRVVSRWLCFFAGLAAGFGTIVPWLGGWAVILAAAGGEYHGIHETGRPTSQRLLHFGGWINGAGNLSRSHIVHIPEDGEIVEHRVGKVYGAITKLVFYEAKYRFRDGSTRIAPADGPEPLVSHRQDVLWALFILGPLLAVAFFVAFNRLGRTR